MRADVGLLAMVVAIVSEMKFVVRATVWVRSRIKKRKSASRRQRFVMAKTITATGKSMKVLSVIPVRLVRSANCIPCLVKLVLTT